jgi:hypothetical protein
MRYASRTRTSPREPDDPAYAARSSYRPDLRETICRASERTRDAAPRSVVRAPRRRAHFAANHFTAMLSGG